MVQISHFVFPHDPSSLQERLSLRSLMPLFFLSSCWFSPLLKWCRQARILAEVQPSPEVHRVLVDILASLCSDRIAAVREEAAVQVRG